MFYRNYIVRLAQLVFSLIKSVIDKKKIDKIEIDICEKRANIYEVFLRKTITQISLADKSPI